MTTSSELELEACVRRIAKAVEKRHGTTVCYDAADIVMHEIKTMLCFLRTSNRVLHAKIVDGHGTLITVEQGIESYIQGCGAPPTASDDVAVEPGTDALRQAVERAKDDMDYCRIELKNDKSKKIGYADLTYADLETLVTHAIKRNMG